MFIHKGGACISVIKAIIIQFYTHKYDEPKEKVEQGKGTIQRTLHRSATRSLLHTISSPRCGRSDFPRHRGNACVRSVPIHTTHYIDACMYMHIVYAPPCSGHIDPHHPFLHTRIHMYIGGRKIDECRLTRQFS